MTITKFKQNIASLPNPNLILYLPITLVVEETTGFEFDITPLHYHQSFSGAFVRVAKCSDDPRPISEWFTASVVRTCLEWQIATRLTLNPHFGHLANHTQVIRYLQLKESLTDTKIRIRTPL